MSFEDELESREQRKKIEALEYEVYRLKKKEKPDFDDLSNANPIETLFTGTEKLMNFLGSSNEVIGLIKKTIIEVRDAATDAAAEIGGGLRYYESISQEISKSQATLAGLNIDVREIGQYQEKFTKGVSTNMVLTAEALENIGVLETLGADGVKMAENFKFAAQSTKTMLDDLQVVGNVAGQYGVNTRIIFDSINDVMKTTDQYRFENGVEGMSKMAARAAIMGVDFKSIVNFADKIMDPQGAIDAVANFQRLGVAVGDLADPFKLMYMAQSDMEGLTNAVAKSVADMAVFNKETGKMEIPAATRMQMKEMGQQLGLSNEEMNNMVTSQAKLAAMSEEFSGFRFDASEEDKLLIASLAEFDKSKGEFQVKVHGETKSVSELNPDDLMALKERPKTLEDTAREQLSVTESIKASVDMIRKSVVSPAVATKAQLDMEAVSRAPAEIGSDAITKAIKDSNIKGTIDEYTKEFTENSMQAFKEMQKSNFTGADEILKGLDQKFKTNFGASADKFIESINDGFAEFPKRLNEKLRDDNIFKKPMEGLSDFIVSFVNEAKEQMVNAGKIQTVTATEDIKKEESTVSPPIVTPKRGAPVEVRDENIIYKTVTNENKTSDISDSKNVSNVINEIVSVEKQNATTSKNLVDIVSSSMINEKFSDQQTSINNRNVINDSLTEKNTIESLLSEKQKNESEVSNLKIIEDRVNNNFVENKNIASSNVLNEKNSIESLLSEKQQTNVDSKINESKVIESLLSEKRQTNINNNVNENKTIESLLSENQQFIVNNKTTEKNSIENLLSEKQQSNVDNNLSVKNISETLVSEKNRNENEIKNIEVIKEQMAEIMTSENKKIESEINKSRVEDITNRTLQTNKNYETDFVNNPTVSSSINNIKTNEGDNISSKNDIINNNVNNQNQSLTSLIQPKITESNILTPTAQSVVTASSIPPIQNKEIREFEKRETISRTENGGEFNVRFDPITIKLEGDGKNVEMALRDSKIRDQIIEMVGDAMSYNYGGKAKLV